MKTFIYKLMIFIIPVFFLALTIEVLIRLIPNDYLLKKDYLDKNSDKIEVLILGSSHSFFDLNPVYFSNVLPWPTLPRAQSWDSPQRQ